MAKSNIQAIYPLTPMQEGMLYHQLAEPNSSAYFLRAIHNLDDQVNIEALKQACKQVIERHGVLRTAFVWEKRDKLIQIVLKQVKLPWHEYDWSHVPAERQNDHLLHFLRADKEKNFDLSKAPLLRLILIHLGQSRSYFIWDIHHILLDGWCHQTLLQELMGCYQAICRQQTMTWKPRRPYRDYVVWIQKQDPAEAEAFWREHLRGFGAPTPLPCDQGQVEVSPIAQQKACVFSLSEGVAQALTSFAKRRGLTLNTLIQGTWGLVLALYSGEKDVVFGNIVSGRPPSIPGVTEMIGLFINTLPVRVRFEGDQGIAPWFSQLQARFTKMRRFEHSSLIDIQSWSEVPRDLPLFACAYTFQNVGKNAAAAFTSDGDDIALESVDDPIDFFLGLKAWPGDRPLLKIHFDYRRFNSAEIMGIARQMKHILAEIARDPNRDLSCLFLPNQGDLELLRGWKNEKIPFASERLFPHIFAARVAENPDAPAAFFEGDQLSYKELDEASDRMARFLLDQGTKTEDRIGLFVGPCFEMLIGILAIWKAGGCYVPLDPEYPQDRNTYIIDDAGIGMILTLDSLRELLPENNAAVFLLGQDHRQPLATPPLIHALNLANIIYTSGSTGKPKGVELHHLSMCNMVCQQAAWKLDRNDRILQFASLNYDASIFEIVWPLAHGASMLLSPRNQLLPGPVMTDLMQEYRITHLIITPSALAHLPEEELPHLKMTISAGEACPSELVARWGRTRTFINAYGPAENTVLTTAGRCHPGEKKPSIGKAVSNVEILVLNRGQQIVPIGSPGELYVTGPGLARGYHGRPGLSAEKFVPNPWAEEGGQRLYKTGDLVRFLGNGNLEFIGRIDNQVKVRGMRVEPGEIEAALKKHEQIKEAVVTVDATIKAFLVSRSQVGADQLRDFLGSSLPRHMVPSAFHFLDAIPLNQSDKVDYRALAALELVNRASDEPLVQARNEREEILIGLWKAVLKENELSIHDDFFDMGGHSLLAIRLVTELVQQFAITQKQGLNWLHTHPTVAGFAEKLNKWDLEDGLAEEKLDLPSEVVLDPLIQPGSAPEFSPPKSIFLTGATGFVGAFLLDQLLRDTDAQIYCLVRASNPEKARERLRDNLIRYQLDADLTRVVPLVGDLGLPRFGLSSQSFAKLAGSLDLIFHNGALVNALYPYASLKTPNVLGTQEALRLACLGPVTPFHHISTLSVLNPEDHRGQTVIAEDNDLNKWQSLNGGYAQSKWVAEKLVMEARSRGLPAAIHRLGRITGDARSGVCHTGDMIFRLLKSFVQTETAPDVPLMTVEMTPVDFLCRAICRLSTREATVSKTYHFQNPNPISLSRLIHWMNLRGFPVQAQPLPQWVQSVRDAGESDENNPLAPILPLLFSSGAQADSEEEENKLPVFDLTNMLRGLEGTEIHCDPVDESLLETYFRFLIESGFLPSPRSKDKQSSGVSHAYR